MMQADPSRRLSAEEAHQQWQTIRSPSRVIYLTLSSEALKFRGTLLQTWSYEATAVANIWSQGMVSFSLRNACTERSRRTVSLSWLSGGKWTWSSHDYLGDFAQCHDQLISGRYYHHLLRYSMQWCRLCPGDLQLHRGPVTAEQQCHDLLMMQHAADSCQRFVSAHTAYQWCP